MTKSQFVADGFLIVLASILAVCTVGTFGLMVKAGFLYAQLVGAAGALTALVVSGCMALIAAATYPRPKVSKTRSRIMQALARVSMNAASLLVVLSVGGCVFGWIVVSGGKILTAPHLSLFVLLCIAMLLAMIISRNLRSSSEAKIAPTKRQIRVRPQQSTEKPATPNRTLRTPRPS